MENPHRSFVGRIKEISMLTDLLSKARSGRGRVVFIEGSAGTGKGTLINEFERRARADGLAKDIEFV
jgi:predicted ATPase